MLSHYGRLMHEGRPVAAGGGARYILAGFVRARPLAEAWRVLRDHPEMPEDDMEDESDDAGSQPAEEEAAADT